MSGPRYHEADLPALLAEIYPAVMPDYRDDVLGRTAGTRQRSAWTSPERWFPMNATLSAAPPLTPSRPWARKGFGPALALLILALLGGALIGAALLAISPGPVPPDKARNGLIAFDAEGDIWVVKPDGTSLRRVTGGPDDKTSPIWSPDGSRLAVWTGAGDATVVRIMDIKGHVEQTIAAPAGATFPSPGFLSCNGAQATWSPDGRWLAAAALDGSSRSTVAILDVATGSGHLLDVGMSACAVSWSPVESLLTFADGQPGAGAVYVSDPDGGDRRRLSPEGRTAWALGFTPDGKGVVADLEGEGTVLLGLDGSQRPLTPEFGASASPDGRWASYVQGAFPGTTHMMPASWSRVANDFRPRELYVTPLDGTSEPRRLMEEVGWEGMWSPDGKLLATLTPRWDELLILDPYGDAAPVRVPSWGIVGVISWQALR